MIGEVFSELISFAGKYLAGYVVGSIVCLIILRPIKVYHEGFDDGWEAARTGGGNQAVEEKHGTTDD